MKLAVVGGASTYTPELVDGLARLRDALPVTEIALLDPDKSRLEPVAGVSRRILARTGHPAAVTTPETIDQAAEGASAVLFQLRVGGQAMRHVDETLPHACGCVGQETVGAGGLAMALRTVPVVLDLARRVAAVAPRAWIVDFTNPVGIVTRALLDAGHRAIGLCNVAIGFQRRFADLLGLAPQKVALDHVGLNHLTWERAVYVAGEDVLPALLDRHGAAIAAQVGLPVELIRRLGAVPSYYLRYYYEHDAVVKEQVAGESRASQVAAIEDELLRLYADPSVDTKPEALTRRGGAYYSEAAVDLLAALLGHVPAVHVVNIRNNGALPFLPDDAVVEVPATITSSGAQSWPVRTVPPLYSGLVSHVAAYESLAAKAARLGGVERVADALLAHPLVGQASLADDLAARLVAANRDHLRWA